MVSGGSWRVRSFNWACVLLEQLLSNSFSLVIRCMWSTVCLKGTLYLPPELPWADISEVNLQKVSQNLWTFSRYEAGGYSSVLICTCAVSACVAGRHTVAIRLLQTSARDEQKNNLEVQAKKTTHLPTSPQYKATWSCDYKDCSRGRNPSCQQVLTSSSILRQHGRYVN